MYPDLKIGLSVTLVSPTNPHGSAWLAEYPTLLVVWVVTAVDTRH